MGDRGESGTKGFLDLARAFRAWTSHPRSSGVVVYEAQALQGAARCGRRIGRHLAEAKLLPGKTLDNFKFNTVPMVSEAQVSALCAGDEWLRNGSSVLLIGPPGGGKSHLSSAMGQALLEKDWRVLFARTSDLVQRLQLARRELALEEAITRLDKTRRIEQRTDKSLKGMRWTLLKDVFSLKPAAGAALHGLITAPKLALTARAWIYKEQLRELLDRKQINVIRDSHHHWCVSVMRSKVEPMKEVAGLVRLHMEGIVAWAQTRQSNGFLETINGLFQAAKRRARGFTRLSTIKTVIFLIAGKLDFQTINPHARQPT
ncbi:MAG: transposase [Betaproteobacteria bacterium]